MEKQHLIQLQKDIIRKKTLKRIRSLRRSKCLQKEPSQTNERMHKEINNFIKKKSKRQSQTGNEKNVVLTFLALSAPGPVLLPADDGNVPVAILENGTGSENLIVCNSCITTFETLRNESLRRLPIAERTPSVLSINGWKKENTVNIEDDY